MKTIKLLILLTLVSCGVRQNNQGELAAGNPDAIEILSLNAKDTDYSTHIYAEVKNVSKDLVSYADFKAVFKDANGGIIGTALGNATNIAAGKTKVVDIIGYQVKDAKSFDVEVNNVVK